MSQSKKQASKQRRTVKRAKGSSKLASYAVTATGVAATLGGAQMAEAGIIWSGIQNVSVPYNAGVPTIIDFAFAGSGLTSGARTQFRFAVESYYGNYDFAKGGVGSNNYSQFAYKFPVTDGILDKDTLISDDLFLPLGDNRSRSINFLDVYRGGGYDGPQDRYLGVRFNPGSGVRYGWINYRGILDANSKTISELTIVSWAFDSSGAAILAGQTAAIPEPSGLAMVALGGLAVAGRRWRRIGQKAAA
jgi:hypothetical protein